jgi:hypothetical protein
MPKAKRAAASSKQGASSGHEGHIPVASTAALVCAVVVAVVGVYLSGALGSFGADSATDQNSPPGVEVSSSVTADIRRKMDSVLSQEDKIRDDGAQYWRTYEPKMPETPNACPQEDEGFKSKPGTKEMTLLVLNKQDVQFALYFIDDKGEEVGHFFECHSKFTLFALF